jgi:predicted acylesterase/phospholipase RssA
VRYLYEGRNWFPEIIAGTSVGSINAAKLAELGRGKNECLAALESLDQIWYDLQCNDHMFLKEQWMLDFERSGLGSLLDNVQRGQMNIFEAVAGLLLPGGVDTMLALDALQRGLQSTSMYNLDPIAARLVPRQDGLGFDVVALKSSSMKVLFATVSLETGEVSYFGNDGTVMYGEPIGGPPVDLAKVIIASASIPTAFPPVELNGQNFVDGGVRDLLPLDGLIDAGAHEIVGVEASVHTPYKQPELGGWDLSEIAERTVNDLLTDEIVRSEAYPRVPDPGVDVTIIRPRVDIHDIMTIDPGLIQIALHYGYMCAFDELESGKKQGKSDPVYKELTTLADAITVERMRNWQREYMVFNYLHPFLPIDGEHQRGVWNNHINYILWMAWNPQNIPVAGLMSPGGSYAQKAGQPIANPNAVQTLRDGKRRVAQLVKQRRKAAAKLSQDSGRPDCLPPPRPIGDPPGREKGSVAWWMDWERHPWTNYQDYASPWVQIDTVPADIPPSP